MSTALKGRRELLAERRGLRRKYKRLYDELRDILNRHDPVGIAGEPDEYEPEVARILARSKATGSVTELTEVIRTVFVEMFDDRTAGPRARYRPIARELWSLLHPN